MEKQRREALFILILFILDMIILFASLPLGYFIRFNILSKFPAFFVAIGEIPQFFPYYFFLNIVLFITWLLIFLLYRVYSIKNLFSFYPVINALTLGLFLVSSLSFFYRDFSYSRLVFILTWILAMGLTFLARIVLSLIRTSVSKREASRVLIIGENETSDIIKNFWEKNPRLNYKAVKILDDIDDIDDIFETIEDLNIQEILITKPIKDEDLINFLDLKRKYGISIKIVPESYLLFGRKIIFDEISGIPIVEVEVSNLEGIQGYIKEIMDFVLGAFGLIIFSPLFFIIAFLIKLDSEGPVFYKHLRVGRYGKPFYLWKFRTMYKDADKILEKYPELRTAYDKDFKLKKDPRITRVGKFLRKFSLDEIPQLFNIIKGEMSIVGPRPVTFKELEKYGEFAEEILRVKPGLTGLWQVSGRSNVDYSRRVQLDLYYIQNWSILLDLKIIMRTIPSVLLGKGAY